MQQSVRAMFLKDISHKALRAFFRESERAVEVTQKRIREPVFGLEAVYYQQVYNPNMVRPSTQGRQPESAKDNFRRHIEELSHAVPYLECLERRQMNAWNLFQNELQERGYENRSLGELRLHWHGLEDPTMLNKLQSLILRGVPSTHRPRIWAERGTQAIGASKSSPKCK